jgi:phosphatidylserine/phosphatidylglycerophosphate/cardiolipin synthase-like enzyme
MNPADLDSLLRQSLADFKLSGSERQALTGFALEHLDSEQDRTVARSRAFAAAREAVGEDARGVLAWLEDVLKVLSPPRGGPAGSAASEAFFSPGEDCLRQIIHRFASARRSADLCVFTITDDRITRALLDAHRRGVQLRLITDNEKAFDAGSDITRIQSAGVPTRVDRTPYHMHHKYALFDGERLLSGSYNWTRGAANDNEENVIDTGDPRLVAVFRQHFEQLWGRLEEAGYGA